MEVHFFEKCQKVPDLRKSQILHFWCDFDQIWIETFSYVYHWWIRLPIIWKERKETFESDNDLDLVSDNRCEEIMLFLLTYNEVFNLYLS